MRTHEKHDNPPAKSFRRVLHAFSTTAFSHHLNHITGLGMLETSMSVHYALTPCDSSNSKNTSFFLNLVPNELYDSTCCTTALRPLVLSWLIPFSEIGKKSKVQDEVLGVFMIKNLVINNFKREKTPGVTRFLQPDVSQKWFCSELGYQYLN